MKSEMHISINKYMLLFRPPPDMTCTLVHFCSAFIYISFTVSVTVKQCCTALPTNTSFYFNLINLRNPKTRMSFIHIITSELHSSTRNKMITFCFHHQINFFTFFWWFKIQKIFWTTADYFHCGIRISYFHIEPVGGDISSTYHSWLEKRVTYTDWKLKNCLGTHWYNCGAIYPFKYSFLLQTVKLESRSAEKDEVSR